ncbi:MAG: RluA family pseudouridine synthase, partial [Caldimonas sp.]
WTLMNRSRIDKAVVAMAPEFSRNHLQWLIDQGQVVVDGEVARTASHKVRAGQALDIVLVPTEESKAFRPEAMPLRIVHEDADVLVIDKPAGLVVHPASGNWTGTLLNGLLFHYPMAATLPRAGIVHRLDKDTSGLLVIGKTLVAVTSLSRQIAARTVSREYVAIVHGETREREFTVDAPIGRDPISRVRMAVVASGRPARTEIRCLARATGFSALACKLHTGRTHQIRVHLASRGHPLVADATYGGRPALGMSRQALHAERLSFTHPTSGLPVGFESSLPHDMASAMATLATPMQHPDFSIGLR